MKTAINILLGLHKRLHRLSKGRFGGQVRGINVLILNTLGRQTRKNRSVPLGNIFENGCYIVAAYSGGASRNPGWYHNLRLHPDAEIDIKGGEKLKIFTQRRPAKSASA
jgi:deazaflavin-dependent oxidoreductase (nitroreductase family)